MNKARLINLSRALFYKYELKILPKSTFIGLVNKCIKYMIKIIAHCFIPTPATTLKV